MSGRKSRSISLRLIWMIVLHILHSDATCQCLICGLLYNEKVFNLAFYMFIDIGKMNKLPGGVPTQPNTEGRAEFDPSLSLHV